MAAGRSWCPGNKAAVERAWSFQAEGRQARHAAAGVRAVPLRLMQPAADVMREALAKVTIRQAGRALVMANVLAAPI
jgi:[acyl-carrier-protein] S-malonyltransferase